VARNSTLVSIARVSFSFGHATGRRPPFKYSTFTRVGFSDTDAQGIVYYGRYMPYFDYARVEYGRHLGLLDFPLAPNEFVMRACEVVYEAPARFDDLLEVFVRTKRLGRSSMTCELCVYRVEDDELMCTAEQTLVLVDPAERRAVAIPDGYREAIERFEATDLELAVPR
jgi:acyl-CoA thioester hydrolase